MTGDRVEESAREKVGEPNNEPLVSVVTPFHNAECYLAECIESVLAQSYRNWEYILVDNCSTDGSGEIARAYAGREERIKLVGNTRFLPQVENYNHALRRISDESRYCKIVQADDWIFPECLTEMAAMAESHPTVGLVGAYRLDQSRVTCDGLPYPGSVLPGRNVCRSSLLNEYFVFGSATSILIRSDIVRSRTPFYNESSYHEDTEACYEILRDHDFGFVHKVLTFTRRENESISSRDRRNDPSHLLDRFVALRKYGSDFLDGPELEKALRDLEARYLRFVAAGALGRRDGEFWEYHRSALEQTGYSLSWSRLWKQAALELGSLLFRPARVARALGRRLPAGGLLKYRGPGTT
jgi:glycosyltransferase involved in cell wall biosynthesis